MIRAVTFDLWDTIVIDDSDEATREAMGLLTKGEARRAAFVQEMIRWTGVTEFQAEEGYVYAGQWCRTQWQVNHITPTLYERFAKGFEYVGFEPSPGFDKLIETFARMEVDVPPRLVPGIEETLQALHGKYKLGIVSDAIVTPGVSLREMMEKLGVAKYFDSFVFSDELGCSKPDSRMFEKASDDLGGVLFDHMVHIGDREEKDVRGSKSIGAQAVLFTGAVDRGQTGKTRADAVCRDMRELPTILEKLSRG